MKFSAALLASASASAGISADLVTADTHFWTNAARITSNADSILKSVCFFLVFFGF